MNESDIKKLNITKLKKHLFEDSETLAYVCRIYDPDTITVILEHKGSYFKQQIRLSGIDAPEKKSLVEKERKLCEAGTTFIKSLILNKMVKLKCGELDKYNRLLAEVFYADSSLNDKLIQGGFVRKYQGEKKQDWNL